MAIEKLNKTYVNNQTKLNAEDFKENVNKINEIIDISDWVLLNSDYNCYYRKTGNFTEINLSASQKNLSFGQNIILGILPEGFRPSKTVRTSIYNRSSSSAVPRNLYIEIQPGGTIYLFNWETTDTFETLNANVCFIN